MRDDERPRDHRHGDEEEERFDDALDDLFGPDEDDEETRPRPSRQTPQPAGGSTPPAREYEPDTQHHQAGAGHVLGPQNAPPPSSYDTLQQPQEPAPATPVETSIPVSTPPKGRNWRRIACFGCLAAVGIPALCLGALIVIGLVVGDPDSEPTEVGVFVDDSTPAGSSNASPTAPNSAGTDATAEFENLPAPLQAVMDGRETLSIEIDGESGFGRFDKPVPLTIRAALGDGWELQINSVTEDANQIVADANMFNEPPANDRQYVIASITATNNTGAASIFDASFRLRLAAAVSGNIYTTFDTTDRCGVIPEPVEDTEIAPGATVTGNVCWQVRSTDVEELVLYNESFNELDGAIWFALTDGLSAR